MKKILFRSDAAPHIGIGDLMSFINLSFYFKDWETFFIIKDYDAALGLVQKYNIKNIFIIDHKISIEDEIQYINKFILKNDIFSIFLQINEKKISIYNNIDIAFRACAYFESDLPNHYDLVLSWNYNSKDYFDLNRYNKTKFFLGTEYVILPMSFDFSKIEKRDFKKKKEKLLISLGGADEKNMTFDVIKQLKNISCDLDIVVILGSGYQFEKELSVYLEKSSLSYEIKKSVDNMYIEYMDCDIAIGAGGLTVSEIVATKTPALIISTYEHQVERCDYFDNKGWIRHLGYMNSTFTKADLDYFPKTKNMFNSKILDVIEYFNKVYK